MSFRNKKMGGNGYRFFREIREPVCMYIPGLSSESLNIRCNQAGLLTYSIPAAFPLRIVSGQWQNLPRIK